MSEESNQNRHETELLKLVGRTKKLRYVMPIWFLIIFALVIGARGMSIFQFIRTSLPGGIIAFTIVAMAVWLTIPYVQHVTSTRLKSLLLELDEPKHVGLLAELAHYDFAIRGRAERVLMRFLPDLQSDEPLNLTPYQRHCLYRLLFEDSATFWRPYRSYGQFPPVLLDFIHKFGGSEAIPYLEDFATWARKQKDPEAKELGDYARAAVGDVRFRTAKAIIDRKVSTADDRMGDAELRVERLQPPAKDEVEVDAIS